MSLFYTPSLIQLIMHYQLHAISPTINNKRLPNIHELQKLPSVTTHNFVPAYTVQSQISGFCFDTVISFSDTYI